MNRTTERGGNSVMKTRSSRSANGRSGASTRSRVANAVSAGVEKISRGVESLGRKSNESGRSRSTSAAGSMSTRSTGGRRSVSVSASATRGRQGRSMPSVTEKRPVGRPAHLPINNYGTLSISDIRGRLSTLSKPDLRKVMNFERRHRGRQTIISAIERRLKSA